MKNNSLDRRTFFKTCLSTATAVAANPNLLAQSGLTKKEYTEALIRNEDNEPLSSESFRTSSHYIFNYPFVTTPCFLIRLDSPVTTAHQLSTAEHNTYQWPGGVGPEDSVVAFSAICAHKLSYPTRATSFINYRPEEVTYVRSDQSTDKRKQLIYCCSERSVYDPSKGAKVLGGPAPQPLTAILIRYDGKEDHYYATATLGGEMYNRFFESFGFRIALEYKNENIRQLTGNSTTAYTPDRYTNHQVRC
jgi:Rieske Fe-S protein